MFDPKPSPVIQANCDLLIKREQVGIQTYGQTLSEAKLPIMELLQHLLEEQLDGANYTQAMLQQLKNQKTFEDGLAERDHLLRVMQRELKLPQRFIDNVLYRYRADAVIRGVFK